MLCNVDNIDQWYCKTKRQNANKQTNPRYVAVRTGTGILITVLPGVYLSLAEDFFVVWCRQIRSGTYKLKCIFIDVIVLTCDLL